MAARLGASLFGGGALITVAALLFPHPEQVDVAGYWGLAAGQVVVAVALLALPLREGWQPAVVAGLGVLAVSVGIYFNGERIGGPPLFTELFYVWPALYVGYFFRRWALLGALVFMAATYAAVLLAIRADSELLATRWSVTVSVVWGVALTIHFLRISVDRLVARLRTATRTDLLTDVLNRRGFEEAFGLELARVRRSGAPLALAIGDIDRFKAINDRYGHAAGDAALKAVAARLRECCRGTDVLARIGGEEFALVMPQTTLDEALVLAERLRRSVALVHDEGGEPLTISFGVVECTRGEDADPDRLLGAADRALYAAKDAGRDRVVSA